VYFNSAYIAKCYVNEPGSAAAEKFATGAANLYSSVLAIAQVLAVFHRQIREGAVTASAARELARLFLAHAEAFGNSFPQANHYLLLASQDVRFYKHVSCPVLVLGGASRRGFGFGF
jgi:predicted nucleic acid-binding protein